MPSAIDRREYLKAYYLLRRDAILENSRIYYALNRMAVLKRTGARRKATYWAHRELELLKNKIYRDAHRSRLSIRKSLLRDRSRDAQYARDNRVKLNAKWRRREAQKLKAVPLWADKKEILFFYELAQACTLATGVAHEVDHIVPLVSSVVCGLHCQANLQVLTKAENAAKRNKWTV